MKVLVCGGRDYSDYDELWQTLKDYPISHIVMGGAKGADTLAGIYAQSMGITLSTYPANWDLHPRTAGFIRNQMMIDEESPDLVIAFPGGNGTADMIKRAEKAGIRVVRVLAIDPMEMFTEVKNDE